MSRNQMIYAEPEKFSLKKLGALLSDGLEVAREKVEYLQRVYLDTFDWRLYKAGMVLEVETRGGLCLLSWRKLGSGEVLLGRTVRKLPKGAGDFSDAGMQSELKKIIGRRSLMVHASLNGSSEKALLLNEDEKTIMRVELRKDQVILPASTRYHNLDGVIYLFPYRGYEQVFKDRKRWAVRDAKLSPVSEDPMISVLNALDITPGVYEGRPTFSLDQKQPAIEALVTILSKFLQIIESNVKGARKDVDPEYLHDFLVAVRRTSILINRFSSLFPKDNLKLIESGFHWVEDETTPIRDLDIYMSLFDDFESRVDEDHREALQSLYMFFQSQKKKELRRMSVSLESPRYFRLIEDWGELLQNFLDSSQLPKVSQTPIGKVAPKCIWDIYKELWKKTREVIQDPKDDEICELHQISKRLGYHMDVFSSLFPAKQMGKLQKKHDELQSYLNNFRDINLQHSRLKDYKAKMKNSQAVRKISLEAVEQLIVDRKKEKAKARKKAICHIDSFTGKKMRKNFKSTLNLKD